MKNYLKILLCSLFTYQGITGQNLGEIDNIFPPSPEASAMAEYAKIPVSHYTGIPNIDLPIMELKGKDISIPISLSYHSAGNKVNEISSSVGLGWTLNAGGAITRVVRGRYDEHFDGYLGANRRGLLINNTDYAAWTNNQFLQYGTSQTAPTTLQDPLGWDSEPDVYYFNFLGFSGRFVMDANGAVIQTPQEDLKILPAIGPLSTNNYWTIIDKSGTKFKFGVTTDEQEESESLTTGLSAGSTERYVSSWFLSSIESPTGEMISFEYKKGAQISYNSTIEQYGDLSCGTGFGTISTETKVFAPLVLEKITSRYGYINFTSIAGREDLAFGNRISEMVLRSHNGALIKTVKLNQDYFSSKENCNAPECKRLKLESIDEKYPFERYIRKYEFTYNTNKLPRRDSPEIDHWGYYNANSQTDFISRTAPEDINIHRIPNETATKSNVLTKITYATGGFTSFTYGLNEYQNGAVNTITGGLRVLSIEDNDKNGNPVITNYKYEKENTTVSSGTEYNRPIYSNDVLIWETLNFPDGSTQPNPCGGVFIRSSSQNELFDLNGSNIGYGEVIVEFTDGTKEINKYTDLLTNPDERQSTDYFNFILSNFPPNTPNGQIIDYLNPLGKPYGPPSNKKAYQRGMLLEQVVKSPSGAKTYQINNVYEEKNQSTVLSAKGYKFDKLFRFDYYDYDPVAQSSQYVRSDIKFDISRYNETNGNYRLTQSTVTTFDGSNEHKIVTNYDYTLEKPTLLRQETTTLSNGDVAKTTFDYPFDLSGTVNNVFVQNNQIAGYIEKTNHINNQQLNREERLFGYNTSGYVNNGGTPLPKQTNFQKKNLNTYTNLIIDRYDAFGNVLQYHGNDNVPISILWGYGDRYPVAKAVNATYDDITASAIGLNTSLINASSPDDAALRNEINKLRTHSSLSAAKVTSFTYRPLIGVTSTTDSRNYTMYYTYDFFNRLQYVKDADNHLITEHQYQYLNQYNGNGSSSTQLIVNVTYGISTDTSQTFISNASGGNGNYVYKWYNGIGTSSTNFESTVSGTASTYSMTVSCTTFKYVKLVTTSNGLTSTRIIRSNNSPCEDGGGDIPQQ